MKKDLLNGTTLVIDRYAFSGVAYTAAKVSSKFCILFSLLFSALVLITSLCLLLTCFLTHVFTAAQPITLAYVIFTAYL